MGLSYSLPEIAGCVSAGALGTVTAIVTSYAFTAGDTNSFGALATVSNGFPFGSLTPVFKFPGTAGGASTVTCAPQFGAGDTVTSILCPVANSNIGAGLATLQLGLDPDTPYQTSLVCSFVTGSSTTATRTATVTNTAPGKGDTTVYKCDDDKTDTWSPISTGKPFNERKCRKIGPRDDKEKPVPKEKGDDEEGTYVVRRDAGYSPPQITLKPGDTPPAKSTVYVTITQTATVTVGGKTVTERKCTTTTPSKPTGEEGNGTPTTTSTTSYST